MSGSLQTWPDFGGAAYARGRRLPEAERIASFPRVQEERRRLNKAR